MSNYMDKVENVRQMLLKSVEKGEPKTYEVKINNQTVIHPTEDLSEFELYPDYIEKKSKFIQVLVYDKAGEKLPKKKFTIPITHSENETEQKGLGALEVQQLMDKTLEHERQKWDADLVKKEKEALEKKIKDSEEYIEQLQNELQSLQTRPNHVGNVDWPKAAGSFVGQIISKNPGWTNALSGITDAITPNDKNPKAIEAPTEITFKSKEDSEKIEEEKEYSELGKFMSESFEQQQLETVTLIIEELANDTSKIKPVAELLDIKAK